MRYHLYVVSKNNNNKLGNRTKKKQTHRELVVTSGKRLREKSSIGGGD